MPVNVISEDEIRAALLPYRVDPAAFAAGVRARLGGVEKERTAGPLASWSPLLRAAAAFLPLEVLAGCKAAPGAASLAPVGGIYKVVSYLAYPAISMFVLLGATVFSIFKIRGIRNQEVPGVSQQDAMYLALGLRMRHLFGAVAVFATTFFLTWIGATWLVFVVYIVSFGLLLYVLNTLAKHGLANRTEISQFCTQGLLFIGIASGSLGHSDQGIHFVNQRLIWLVFMVGVYILIFITFASLPLSIAGQQGTRHLRGWMIFALMLAMSPILLVVPSMFARRSLISRPNNQIQPPATPAEIKGHVESFAEAPHSSATWHHWEISAQWAIDAKLNPDMAKPRQLLAEEIVGEQNPFILGSAVRVGLLSADQTGELRDYARWRKSLLAAGPRAKGPQAILSLDFYDWAIRTAALRNDLSVEERDRLEQRLLATLERMSGDQYVTLKTALRATQLLEVIERPINRDEHREKMHGWLLKFHDTTGRTYQPGGGFKGYLNIPSGMLEPTAHAVELMEIYGVPSDLDLKLVRSYLRHQAVRKVTDWHFMAAATLQRLDRLQGLSGKQQPTLAEAGEPEKKVPSLQGSQVATRPTWLEILYYERTLLAAVVLVGLCIYATVSAPRAKVGEGWACGVQGSAIGSQESVGSSQKAEGRGADPPSGCPGT